MAGFQLETWIARSVPEVFDFSVDPRNAPRVVSGVTACEQISEGPLGVGTWLRETRVSQGKEHQADLEVVSFERPQRYGVRNETKGIQVVYEYTFEASQSGTLVKLDCRIGAQGFRRFLVPVVRKILQKEDGEHLEHLKRAIESPAA